MLGALFIGGGGRVVMRLLALSDERPIGLTAGGTLEVVVYGALCGAAGGLVYLALARLGWSRPALGAATGLLTFAGTALTLPPHLAATAEPFLSRSWLLLLLFGACFIAYGLALAALAGRRAGRN